MEEDLKRLEYLDLANMDMVYCKRHCVCWRLGVSELVCLLAALALEPRSKSGKNLLLNTLLVERTTPFRYNYTLRRGMLNGRYFFHVLQAGNYIAS